MDKNLKYELTEEFTLVGDKKIFRIQALKEFGDVKSGDLGGFIEKEDNLSHEGNCWIYDNAKVYENAWVYHNAVISENAWVYGNAKIYGGAWVYGDARVYGNAVVSGDAEVSGKAKVFGNSQVAGNAVVYDDSWPVSPFYLRLLKHSITSYNYSEIKIGCEIRTIEEWKERGKEIGKENGYSDTEIALYLESVLFAEKYIELTKKEAIND